jgi:hypothetical protein
MRAAREGYEAVCIGHRARRSLAGGAAVNRACSAIEHNVTLR